MNLVASPKDVVVINIMYFVCELALIVCTQMNSQTT